MELKSVQVSRCLDRKVRLMGFEVFDLIAIFITLSVLHLLFDGSKLKIPLTWLPTIMLACILHFGKRGKPENFLLHWARYQIQPGTYSAFKEGSLDRNPPKLSRRTRGE